MKTAAQPVMPARPVAVWDRFVRVFHWSLVACVLLNQFVLEEGEPLHRWAGYVASALVLARVAWGFIGSRHARFSDFFPTPALLREHAAALLRGRPTAYVGHSPMGALMMLTLMALVLALGLTGWLQGTDRFWGEDWLQELHEGLAAALLGLAGVHALAAIVLGRLEGVDLVRAMLTGVKRPR